MDLEREIYSINDAYVLLKENEILQNLDNNPSFFRIKNQKVQIINKNYVSYITFEEFLTLYEDVKFIIHEIKDDEIIDENKDKEYYSWSHK